MNLEYLLSFQKNEEVQNLDSDTLKLFTSLFLKNYSKKVKKKIIKPTNNILKNQKIQISKDKTQNKANLILNKLSKNNFDNLIKEFIKTFQEIDYEEYKKILQVFYTKIVKDEKFSSLFLKFCIQISNIYNHFFEYNIDYFFDLIEKKTKYDYFNYKLEPELSFLLKLDKEENRINNLKLIVLLIDNKLLDFKVIPEVSKMLINTNNIPEIYTWFSTKVVNKIDNIKKYNLDLKSKLTEDINNRFIVLLKNLMDSNDIQYESEAESTDLESENDEAGFNNEDKSDYEIEIENILEEYILLEDFEEILNFINDYKDYDINFKIFVDNLINLFFKKNLSCFDKFKNLFINLKKNKLINNDLIKNSLKSLIDNDYKDDYINFDSKLNKMIEIFKIIQIKIPKNFKDSSNNISV